MNVEERFWPKVDKTGDCWTWTARVRNGYGLFQIGGIAQSAHRVSYELAHGPIPEGMQVDHTCHNRACVNPDHLRLVTHAQNHQNRSGAQINSKSGIRGVYRLRNGRWAAQAQLDGKNRHLGCFGTAEEAGTAISAWRREHMPWSVLDRA